MDLLEKENVKIFFDYLYLFLLILMYHDFSPHLQSMKAPDLKERLEESEKLIKEMTKTWEEKLAETEKIHQVSNF